MDPKDLVAGLTAAAPGWSRLDLPHRELLDGLQRRAVDDLRRSGDLQGLAEALRTIDIARFCGAAGEGMARLREQVIQCLAERDAATYDVDPGRDGRALESIREQATVDRVARASQFHSCELMVAGAKHTVTLRFVTTDLDLGPAQIAVAGVCPGVISKRKRVLIPHIEVRTRSLPDRMLDALDRAAATNEIARVGGDQGLASEVARTCRLALARIPAADRGGEAALGVACILEAVLATSLRAVPRDLLEEVERFKQWIGLTVTYRGRASAVRHGLLEARETLRLLTGRSSHAAAGKRIHDAEVALAEHDFASVTRALGLLFAEIGELAAADVSLRETLHALSAQVVALLLGPLGAQILDKEDQQLKAFLRQSAWQYTPGPMEGRPRGQFVRLLRPGVALGPWCVVPPRIEVSRAQKGRVHRFLEDFERAAGAAGAASIAGAENLGADLRALADAYRDRDGPSLEADAQVLREMFACLGARYGLFERPVRDRVAAFFGDVFGASIERPETGDAASPSRHHIVEWQRNDAPRGQVLAIVQAGVSCPRLDVTIPAQVLVSRGPQLGHPFLLRLQRGIAGLPVGVQDPVRQLLQTATDSFGDLLVTNETRTATLGCAMELANVLFRGEFADHAALRAELVAFLAENGCRPVPAEDEVLPLSRLHRSGAFDVVLRFDADRIAGDIVKVLVPGWEIDGEITRRAKVEVGLGPEPGIARVYARGLELAKRSPGIDPEQLAAAKEAYQAHIAPVADWYARTLGDGHVEPRARRGMVRLLRAYETIAAQVAGPLQEDWSDLLDRLAEVMVEHGFDVRPRARRDRPGNAGTSVFDDSVPLGGIVRIERRAVIDTRGDVPGDESGTVWISAGPRPRFLARLHDIQSRTGPLAGPLASPLAGLQAIDEGAAAAIQDAGRLTVDFFREHAAAIAAIIAAVEQAPAAPNLRDQGHLDSAGANGGRLAEWLVDLFGSLREHGVDVAPLSGSRPLRHPAFHDMFDTGTGMVAYGARANGLPRSFPVSIERRAWSVDGNVIVRGRVVVSGGDGDRFTRRLSEVLTRLETRRAVVADGLARLAALDDEAVFAEVCGVAPESVQSRRCGAALDILESLQEDSLQHDLQQGSVLGGGPAAAMGEVVAEAREAIRREFGVAFLPAEATAESVARARTDLDEVEICYGGKDRGSVEVRRHGWEHAGRRVPFAARVFLGAPPPWYEALRTDFADVLGGSGAAPVRAAIEQVTRPDLASREPDAVADTLASAYAAICTKDGKADRAAGEVGRRLLDFLVRHLDVQAFPKDDDVFDRRDRQWAGAEVEVALDPAASVDFMIPADRIRRRGLRTSSGRVLLQPRFTVLRKALPAFAAELIGVIEPRLSDLGSSADAMREQLRQLRLVTNEDLDAESVRQEVVQALIAARRESRLAAPGRWDGVKELWEALEPILRSVPAWDALEQEQPYGAILDCIRELGAYPTEQLADWARQALAKQERLARLEERVLDYERVLLQGLGDRAGREPGVQTDRHSERIMQAAIDCVNILASCQSDLFLDPQSNERDMAHLWTFLGELVFEIEIGLARVFQVTRVMPSERGAIDLRLFYEPQRRSRAGGYPNALIQNNALLVSKPCYQQKREDGEHTVQTGQLVKID